MEKFRNYILAGMGVFLAGAALGAFGIRPGGPQAAPSRAAAALRQTSEALRRLRRTLGPASLVSIKPHAPAPGPFHLEHRRPKPRPVPTAPRPRIPAPELRVSVILTAGGSAGARALVNGRSVKVGDSVAGWKVVAILNDAVKFRKGSRTLVRRVGENGAP